MQEQVKEAGTAQSPVHQVLFHADASYRTQIKVISTRTKNKEEKENNNEGSTKKTKRITTLNNLTGTVGAATFEGSKHAKQKTRKFLTSS
jgi:hypothetical protein